MTEIPQSYYHARCSHQCDVLTTITVYFENEREPFNQNDISRAHFYTIWNEVVCIYDSVISGRQYTLSLCNPRCVFVKETKITGIWTIDIVFRQIFKSKYAMTINLIVWNNDKIPYSFEANRYNDQQPTANNKHYHHSFVT